MSLGSELAPHLPFLRRYARALTGSQSFGDALVRGTLETIVADPDNFPRRYDARTSLYKAFHEMFAAQADEVRSQISDKVSEGAEKVALDRLANMPLLARQALLLTSLEGFASKQAGYILQVSGADVDGLVADALNEIERQTQTRVLIIEPDGAAAKQIRRIVNQMGHTIIGTATTALEARRLAKVRQPGLVISEVRLSAAADGVAISREISGLTGCPVIFVSEYAEELLAPDRPDRSYFVLKPFENIALKTAIAQALFYGSPLPPIEASAITHLKPSIESVRQSLVQKPAPIDAEVIRGQIRLQASRAPKSTISLKSLETLREDHRADIERLGLLATNLGQAFKARLDRLSTLLAEPLTEQSTLRIANQTEALCEFRSAIEECLNTSDAADAMATLNALRMFSRQFPIWRQFEREAAHLPPIAPEAEGALNQISDAIEDQPNQIVSAEIKDAISEVRETSNEASAKSTKIAFARGVANVVKAVARYMLDRLKGAGSEFNKAIDKEIGTGLASAASSFLVAISTPLAALALHLPNEFAWAGPVLAIIREATRKR